MRPSRWSAPLACPPSKPPRYNSFYAFTISKSCASMSMAAGTSTMKSSDKWRARDPMPPCVPLASTPLIYLSAASPSPHFATSQFTVPGSNTWTSRLMPSPSPR
ncbi:hypothetical protein B0H17DRAFT_1079433 [Mycena rosella]|uniref:Uncharacterized protein n=1 Tax=Mycena rosella TaxID=1033263 RepID=A0AAD7GCS1_MYCRO|nr:hypothetical protein B0H17DRAFT_1079433 [Mycena rosella]